MPTARFVAELGLVQSLYKAGGPTGQPQTGPVKSGDDMPLVNAR